MIDKKFFIGIGVLLLVSCGEVKKDELVVEQPKNLIPKEKFIQIMAEVSVLESHIQREIQRPEQYAIPMSRSVDSILVKYDVDIAQYDISFDYYGVQQEEIKSIYQAVFDTISNRNNRLKEKSLKKTTKK